MLTKLEIRKDPPGTEQRIHLEGRLDASWAGHLDDYLNGLVREGSYRLIVNMAGVHYLSSAGIRILVSQYKNIKKIGGMFVLEELSEPVREVLTMVGMIGYLTDDTPEAVAEQAPQSTQKTIKGYRFDYEPLSKDPMEVELIGNPNLMGASGYTEADNRVIHFPSQHYALGIGAIGSGFEDCENRYGEFLALGEALVYKPSDGTKVPDYTVRTGRLEPEVNALYGIVAHGEFNGRVFFEPAEPGITIPAGDLAAAFGEISGLNRFVFLMVAESDGLVGVSLSTPPVGGKNLFEFPEVRENFHFTTEAAHARMLTVSFGVCVTAPTGALRSFLRPERPGSDLFTHIHTVIFPYQAMAKKEVSAAAIIQRLFESSVAGDVLHLIHDSREIAGLGSSSFRQGSAWIGRFNDNQQNTGQ
jgi:anti-anti-sigma factor